jgi:hypothetical protein
LYTNQAGGLGKWRGRKERSLQANAVVDEVVWWWSLRWWMSTTSFIINIHTIEGEVINIHTNESEVINIHTNERT